MSSTVSNSVRRAPAPFNEPVRSYAPRSTERAELKARLAAIERECPDVPLVMGGRAIRTSDPVEATAPYRQRHVTATWHRARGEDVRGALVAAVTAATVTPVLRASHVDPGTALRAE